jgi:hypothetical protein
MLCLRLHTLSVDSVCLLQPTWTCVSKACLRLSSRYAGYLECHIHLYLLDEHYTVAAYCLHSRHHCSARKWPFCRLPRLTDWPFPNARLIFTSITTYSLPPPLFHRLPLSTVPCPSSRMSAATRTPPTTNVQVP